VVHKIKIDLYVKNNTLTRKEGRNFSTILKISMKDVVNTRVTNAVEAVITLKINSKIKSKLIFFVERIKRETNIKGYKDNASILNLGNLENRIIESKIRYKMPIIL
jgi:hypothetical protein